MKSALSALVIAVPLFTAPAYAQDFGAGWVHYLRADYAAALREFRPLAARGNAEAQYFLGLMYDSGNGLPQDNAAAVNWFRLSAEQGHASAQFSLGGMYWNGRGVRQAYAEAIQWYRLAAAQGDTYSQYFLGAAYEHGWYMPQDYVRAHMWFDLAAVEGEESAARERDKIANRMTPADISAAQRMAREWLGAHPR